MILDGYWKKELKHISRQLCFWTKHRLFYNDRYIEHKVNRAFLFSAAIIRKIIEDEKDVENTIKKHNQVDDEKPWSIPELPIIKIKVPIIKYKYIAEDKFFVNSRVFIRDYDTKNSSGEHISLDCVCNQIIHSYAWQVVYKDMKNVHGVMMASDWYLEKEAYLVTVSDWIKVINTVVNKSCI
ncbi:MAG: hypothetical protein IK014_00595 [Lachnospiraceae bacterium]|nr:hypothetical protein [Lachnospiraceae bacterium]